MEFMASQQFEGIEGEILFNQDEKIAFTDICGLPRCMVSKHMRKANLSMCSACKEVAYCCKEHQVEHFKEGGHKTICKGAKDRNPLTFNECYEKASKFHQAGQYRSAITFYAAMLELTEKTLGSFDPQAQKLLEQLIFCYKQVGRYPEAIQCFQRYVLVSEMFHTNSLEDNKKSFSLTGQLAEMYIHAGNYDVAKKMLLKTVEGASESFGETSFEKGLALNSLASCLDRLDDHIDAENALLQALSLQGFGGSTNKEQFKSVSEAFFNLGVIQLNLKKHDDALVNFERSKQIKVSNGVPVNDASILEINDFITKAKQKEDMTFI